jgi:hypothetical protein
MGESATSISPIRLECVLTTYILVTAITFHRRRRLFVTTRDERERELLMLMCVCVVASFSFAFFCFLLLSFSFAFFLDAAY